MSVQATKAIPRSRLDDLLAPDFFLWAAGIEDTFITDPHPRTGRILDEYELTQHYSQWREDIDLLADLGVKYARYGIPWHRIQPESSRFDYSWPDQVFERMLARGVHPIVDLMHYGTPPWLEGGFGNLDYPERVSEYAAHIAERFKGQIRWYTPLNEPRITAYYCGRLGWWPPYGRSWRGFVSVMVSVCRGIILTQRRLQAIDSEIVCAHVDATDIYRPAAPENKAEAERRQEIVFLALDLVSGKVTQRHALRPWLQKNGMSDNDLSWFAENAIQLDVVGLNLYPLFTNKLVKSSKRGSRVAMPYGSAKIIEDLAGMYWQRYERPMFISETASDGRRRAAWLVDSIGAVNNVRSSGMPMIGYTWWPLFALVAWAYREKELPFERYLFQLGLYDLALAADGNLKRVSTPLVEAYRDLVSAGAEAVGPLRRMN